MIENKNNKPAGKAMIKLKDMADALSYKPSVFNCFIKNLKIW
jgi:hypothetical protein